MTKQNALVNNWADGIKDRITFPATVIARPTLGSVSVLTDKYNVTLRPERADFVSLSVEGRRNKAHRRRSALKQLSTLGYHTHRDGDAIVTRVEACRRDIADLIDVLNVHTADVETHAQKPAQL
jgi:hypothetical protein